MDPVKLSQIVDWSELSRLADDTLDREPDGHQDHRAELAHAAAGLIDLRAVGVLLGGVAAGAPGAAVGAVLGAAAEGAQLDARALERLLEVAAGLALKAAKKRRKRLARRASEQ